MEVTGAAADAGTHTQAREDGRLPARVAAAALGVLVLLQLGALVSTSRTSTAQLALDVVAAVAGLAGLPLLWRRPVLAAIFLGALAALSPAATPTATCAVLAVSLSRPYRVAAGVAGVGVVAHLVQGLWRPLQGLPFGWWMVLVLVGYATLVGWGAFLQARRALLISLHERARRAEEEQARRVAEARVLERTRIAREMHDVLAHRLSLLATYAGALEYRPDSPPERLAAAAGVVRAGVHQALDELRQVISVLRTDEVNGGQHEGPVTTPPSPAKPQPTLVDLPGLVEENRAAGMHVDLFHGGVSLSGVPAALGRTAYRILQEAMTNARRHAPGQPVRLTLRGEAGRELEVTAVNALGSLAATDGAHGSGTGLVGLRERVQLVGGTLEADHTAAEFRLAARLPWPT